MPVPKRRTQRERREGTIRKLLDATTDTLIDLGYAAASVQRICDRAGVSQGALFRHFATREELMVAAGEDVGARLLERYRRRFATLARSNRTIDAALRLLREVCRSRLNQAWYELAVAARTSARLRGRLEPVARRHFAAITGAARELLPELAASLGPEFDVFVSSVIAMFDGEVVHRLLLQESRLDQARLELLVRAVSQLARSSR